MIKKAKCFGLYDNDKIIGFIGIITNIGKNSLKIKRVTRLVILPDYQGIGLGYKFLNFIAELYIKAGYRFRIVTSAKNLIYKLNGSQLWELKSFGFGRNHKIKKFYGNHKARYSCKIASFEYLPKSTKKI